MLNRTIVLFDTPHNRAKGYPFTLLRPLPDLLSGMFTLKQWWEVLAETEVYCLSENYLGLPAIPDNSNGFLCINSEILPDKDLLDKVFELPAGSVLENADGIAAFATNNIPQYNQFPIWPTETVLYEHPLVRIYHVFDLVKQNADIIVQQVALTGREPVSHIDGIQNIVLGNGLYTGSDIDVNACVFNTTTGPIVIGNNVTIMEGCMLRGPLVILDHTVVKMGSKIYGGTSIGKNCLVGGEIKNTVFIGNSNKAHDGYLGDSYIGEWCNMGAGTTNSNVKNTASTVKLWYETTKSFEGVGNKVGLMMGDHSCSAINTTFNTGTVLGIFCNVFGAGYPNKHVESFNWGGFEKYVLTDALNHASKWMAFKNVSMDETYKRKIEFVYNK
ncbi:putative sugar nucleotidyl transferase [Polluticaenibacter yanchengensis]|uniref:Sugar nucleotidyl transferase n=1 Tax=Polluticaenibacter yanchengensis TaxID=3014562 RepID=A0ABT4UHJ5_9BACT|nr:putative sugar nucleotidyl transferase [Chitinophagaceae bacterium LY-5]